jgi:hypothetical protein
MHASRVGRPHSPLSGLYPQGILHQYPKSAATRSRREAERPAACACPLLGNSGTAPRPPVKPRSIADMHAWNRLLRWSWRPLRLSVHPGVLPLGTGQCPNHHRERAGGLGLTRQRGHESQGCLRAENRRRHRVSPLSVRPEGRRSRLWGAPSPLAPAPGALGHLGCETTALRLPLPPARSPRPWPEAARDRRRRVVGESGRPAAHILPCFNHTSSPMFTLIAPATGSGCCCPIPGSCAPSGPTPPGRCRASHCTAPTPIFSSPCPTTPPSPSCGSTIRAGPGRRLTSTC